MESYTTSCADGNSRALQDIHIQLEILKENKKTILQEILSQSVEAVNYLKNAGEKKDEKFETF